MSRHRPSGQVLLLSAVFLAVVLGLTSAYIKYASSVNVATRTYADRGAARQAASAGIDKAIWCLNQSSGTNCGSTYGLNYAGESSVQVATSTYFTTTVAAVAGNRKTITSTGYYPSVEHPVATVVLKADVTIDTEEASFHYGVQAGKGGFIMSNNAYIDGNIYANASIQGANGAYITGDAWVAGGTALAPDQVSATNTEDYVFGQTTTVIDVAQSFQLSSDTVLNKITLYVKKISNPSDISLRILADSGGVPSKTVLATGTLNAGLVTTNYGWIDVSFGTPPALLGGHTYWLSLDASQSATKYWALASDTANSYPSGRAMYSANWNASPPVWTDAARDFDFKVWTGGDVTGIYNLNVRKDAHAHEIDSCDVDGDAYYQTKSGTTVGGTSHPGTPDPGPQDMPISDAQIAGWQADAAAGGTTTGDVTISGQSSTLGPRKITGNLTVTNGGVLTLTGTVWVQGSINLSNNALVKLTTGYGANSGILLSDGDIDISNNVSFGGSGTPGSYVIVLTTSDSNTAMTLANNSQNSIFYAPNGTVSISNNATLKEITAFRISMSPGASVSYESGLANVNFSTGPGASWTLASGTTREVK